MILRVLYLEVPLLPICALQRGHPTINFRPGPTPKISKLPWKDVPPKSSTKAINHHMLYVANDPICGPHRTTCRQQEDRWQLDTWPDLVRSGMRKALKTNCSVTSPQRDRHVSPWCRLLLWSFYPLHAISISALPQAHRRSTFDLKVWFILAVESKYGVNLNSSSAVAIARAGHVVYVHKCMRSHVRCRVWGGYLEVMCQVVGQAWNKRVTWNCTPFRFLLFLGVRETLLERCSSVLKWLTRAGSFLTWCSGYVPFSQITYIYSRELIVSGVVRIF